MSVLLVKGLILFGSGEENSVLPSTSYIPHGLEGNRSYPRLPRFLLCRQAGRYGLTSTNQPSGPRLSLRSEVAILTTQEKQRESQRTIAT